MEEDIVELDLAAELGSTGTFSIQQLTLYIPQRDSVHREIEDQRRWVEEAAGLLADIGGGFTILPPVEGGWMNQNHEIVWENTVLIYSYVDPDRLMSELPRLRAFLHKLGRETNQGEVAVEFDGEFHLISKFDAAEENQDG